MNATPTTQILRDYRGDQIEELTMPAAHIEVVPGVPWGLPYAFFQPAFWFGQLWYTEKQDRYGDYRWSRNLREEIVACLLGGHGITAEMNEAAYDALKTAGLLDGRVPTEEEITSLLAQPLPIAGRKMRYRYPNMKGRFVHQALTRLATETPPSENPETFRKWLLSFKGIGIKTASWITRNALDCKTVAVIDIHVFRAGVIMGLYTGKEVLPRDYQKLEQRFLLFAEKLGADPRRLDVLIWRGMRSAGEIALNRFLETIGLKEFPIAA